MLILTDEDIDFPAIQTHLKGAKNVGRIIRDGWVEYLKVSEKFVLRTSRQNPQEIALLPARGMKEAKQLADRILGEEIANGVEVERIAD